MLELLLSFRKNDETYLTNNVGGRARGMQTVLEFRLKCSGIFVANAREYYCWANIIKHKT